ncbi:hypothetical protein [Tissierella sp.]|nr:hypothetical protein [Tissierella sp.]
MKYEERGIKGGRSNGIYNSITSFSLALLLGNNYFENQGLWNFGVLLYLS